MRTNVVWQRGEPNTKLSSSNARSSSSTSRSNKDAQQRVEQLFSDLASPDYATQDRARQGILQMYGGNRQAQALMETTRQQILAQMAQEFGSTARSRRRR